MVVVGGDLLAMRVCEELLAAPGQRVTLLWRHVEEHVEKLCSFGCGYVAREADDYDALTEAGVAEASAIMVLTEDDRLNLQVALKARDLNPTIRLVLRQFNRTLGRKIEQNLRDCSVISVAAHSAPAFVGRALDPSCFYALQFPDLDGVQLGFAQRPAAEFGVAGITVRAAQQHVCGRVLAARGAAELASDAVLRGDDELIVFAPVERLEATRSAVVRTAPVPTLPPHAPRPQPGVLRRLRETIARQPILSRFVAAVLAIFVLAVVYFAVTMHYDPITAFYFVATTFTSTGYGDLHPERDQPVAMLVSNAVMFTGVAAIGIFIAVATAALTRAQFNAMQGLRRIRTAGHVLVAGSGNVGTRVIGYLLDLGKQVVVIEMKPDSGVIEMSRARRIELLTGDATRDTTLDLCNVAAARAVVAVTDSDTANLEVALGALARNAGVPVVVRVRDEAFAGSIARQFEAIESYSPAALAAPAFAVLAHSPGTRGRIAFGEVAYDLVERGATEGPQPPAAEDCIPLGVWRNEGTGRFVPVDTFREAEPFDRLLFLAPLGRSGSGQRGGTVLEAGTALPDVGAKDQDGNDVRLRDFKGRKLVVYFYPKADTPGCTAESQAFRDAKRDLDAAGAAIVGVSRDDVAAQKRFAEKYGLNFPLLADTESVICDAFGVIVEKNMYGKKSVGIQRSTFLAGPDGTLAKVWPRVSVEGHDKAVLEAVRSL